MKPSTRRADPARFPPCAAAACAALVAGQVMLLGHLLGSSVTGSIAFALPAGWVAGAGCAWKSPAGEAHFLRAPLVTFAAGGLGMLLGFTLDLGPLGLYGLLERCRSLASDSLWPRPAELWQMMTLMPWACAGMLAGGAAGLALVGTADRRGLLRLGRHIGVHGLCNAGMLLGMTVAGHMVTRLTAGMGLHVAAALMLLAMLLGMAVGMGLPLACAARLPRIGHTPARA